MRCIPMGFRWVAGLVIVGISADLLKGGEGSAGVCGPGTVEVRGQFRLVNRTGQTADDLHFYMYQNDRPSVHVLGAKAGSPQFGTVGVTLGTDNGQGGTPPPGNHGAQVDMTGGSVPPGSSVKIDVSLCMNEQNVLKFKDIQWTFTGGGGGGGGPPQPARRSNGFRIYRPIPGGPGGRPATQEGNGGTGRFLHRVCIENDDPFDPLPLREVRLFASMTFYANLEDINWNLIPPIQDANGEPPVVIPPGGRWCVDFPTTGSYVGGHIYIRYSVDVVGGPLPLKTLNTQDEEDITFGDHPVDSQAEPDVLAGHDYWMTAGPVPITFGEDVPAIPPDFFGPGSDPFIGVLTFRSWPPDMPGLGLTDTIIRRRDTGVLNNPSMPAEVPIELVKLSLISLQPLFVDSYLFDDISAVDVIQPFTGTDPGMNPVEVALSNDNGTGVDEYVNLGLANPPPGIQEVSMTASDDGGGPGQWGSFSFFDIWFDPVPPLPPEPLSGSFDIFCQAMLPDHSGLMPMPYDPYVEPAESGYYIRWYTVPGPGLKQRHTLSLQSSFIQPVTLNDVQVQGLVPGLGLFRILVYFTLTDPQNYSALLPGLHGSLTSELMVFSGGQPYDVFYTNDPNQPTEGTMTISRDNPLGGTFTMNLTYIPLLSFVPLGIEGGKVEPAWWMYLELPGFPITVSSTGPTPWRYSPAPPVPYPMAGPNFWPLPDVQHPLTLPAGGTHALIPTMSAAAPEVVYAFSRRTHGDGFFDQDLRTPSGNYPRSIEDRQGGPTLVIVIFDKPIIAPDGLDLSDVSVTGGTVNAVSIVNGYELHVVLGGVANGSHVSMRFPGIADSTLQYTSSKLCFVMLTGDVNGDGNVNIFDLVSVRNQLGRPVTIANFRADLSPDNAINIFDLVIVRNNVGRPITGSCPP